MKTTNQTDTTMNIYRNHRKRGTTYVDSIRKFTT